MLQLGGLVYRYIAFQVLVGLAVIARLGQVATPLKCPGKSCNLPSCSSVISASVPIFTHPYGIRATPEEHTVFQR